MEKRDLIETEIEKTLNSLDGMDRAEVNPFLYTKIANRLDEQETSESRFNFKVAIAVVIVCLLINLVTYFYSPWNSYTTEYDRETKLQTVATEYSFSNNYYLY